MSLSRREAALLGLLLMLVGLYLTNNYIFYPLLVNKQQLISENNNLSMELQELQSRISKYRSMQKDGFQIRYDYENMLDEVPASPMIPSIIGFIESKARDTNVKLISIRYKENTDGDIVPNYTKSGSNLKQATPVNFKIVANGSRFDLLSFVLEIENAHRIFIINRGKISLGRTDQSPSGIAVPVNNTATAISDQGMAKTIPESTTYNQSKSVLDLDFSAYYQINR